MKRLIVNMYLERVPLEDGSRQTTIDLLNFLSIARMKKKKNSYLITLYFLRSVFEILNIYEIEEKEREKKKIVFKIATYNGPIFE